MVHIGYTKDFVIAKGFPLNQIRFLIVSHADVKKSRFIMK